MIISRRRALALPLLASAWSAAPAVARELGKGSRLQYTGNPLRLPMGVCDPQIRIFDDVAWLYATHDASPTSSTFTMKDWQIWRSDNLVNWSHEGTLLPEQTYFGKPSSRCWATDAIRRNSKYYLYFSMGPEDIGVVVSDAPAGPWRDPLGRALIAKGQVPTETRDPGIFQEADGTSYIVFGTFDYYIARLSDDMISLAETPRKITIADPEGPYGPGKTDDKPFLHRRGKYYYLSWGTYYGIGTSPYGPFQCKGPLLLPENVEPSFLKWRGHWFLACNDQSQEGTTPLFRQSVIFDVHYLRDGRIAPVQLTANGVISPR